MDPNTNQPVADVNQQPVGMPPAMPVEPTIPVQTPVMPEPVVPVQTPVEAPVEPQVPEVPSPVEVPPAPVV